MLIEYEREKAKLHHFNDNYDSFLYIYDFLSHVQKCFFYHNFDFFHKIMTLIS